MRSLALLLLLACAPVWAATGSAAADTWYIRPVATCPNNGDGLAYNCAASGGASGAFSGFNNLIKTTTTGIDDGDTVRVCGNFVQADAETQFTNQAMLAIEESGSAGSVITWTGDCTAVGGSARATLTSDGTSGSLIRTYANTYITIAGTFDLVGAKDAGMTLYNSSTGDVAISKNIRVESGTTITNIHGGTQPVGITYSGTDGYIGAVTISDIGVDGIFEYSGGRWIIDGPVISNISTLDTNGDCVQLQRVVNGDVVRNMYCDKTLKDAKQCVVASCLNAGSATCATGADQSQSLKITDNTCLMASTGSLSIGIFSEGQAYVARNFISNPRTYGLTCDLNASANCTFESNIIVNPGTGCIGVHKTSAGPAATISNNNCWGSSTYGINAAANTSTITAKNNTLVGAFTYGIYRGASGTSDSYNNIFGAATPYSDNGVAGSASAGDKAVSPGHVDGDYPTRAAGFCLSDSSALNNAGAYIGPYVKDYYGHEFDRPPHIGAMTWCRDRVPSASRVAASRVAN